MQNFLHVLTKIYEFVLAEFEAVRGCLRVLGARWSQVVSVPLFHDFPSAEQPRTFVFARILTYCFQVAF